MYEEESLLDKISFRALFITGFFISLSLASFLPIWTALEFCPNLFIMMLYLWLVYRPDLVSLRVLAVVGGIQDGLHGHPLGVSLLEISLLFAFCQFLRRVILEKSFGSIFMGYVAYLLVYTTVKWLILSCFKQEWLSLVPMIRVMVFSLLVYPLVCELSVKIQYYIDKRFDRVSL